MKVKLDTPMPALRIVVDCLVNLAAIVTQKEENVLQPLRSSRHMMNFSDLFQSKDAG